MHLFSIFLLPFFNSALVDKFFFWSTFLLQALFSACLNLKNYGDEIVKFFKLVAHTLLFFSIVLVPHTEAQVMGELMIYPNMSQAALQRELNFRIRIGDADGVKVLLILGANPNGMEKPAYREAITGNEFTPTRTPLTQAIHKGWPKIVKLLLNAGARMDRSKTQYSDQERLIREYKRNNPFSF